MNDKRGTILGVESAIGGGSLSLIRDGVEVGCWTGSASTVARAENLLVNIDEILARAALSASDIDLVAVSAGPGSFTGIRIGIATALGLVTGLGAKMASQSALKAMVVQFAGSSANVIAAVPMGRDAVCIQGFKKGDARKEPSTVSEDQFLELVEQNSRSEFVVHADLYDKLERGGNIIDTGANIAHAIGVLCESDPNVITPPLFIAKSF